MNNFNCRFLTEMFWKDGSPGSENTTKSFSSKFNFGSYLKKSKPINLITE